jgi:hypothetical protein
VRLSQHCQSCYKLTRLTEHAFVTVVNMVGTHTGVLGQGNTTNIGDKPETIPSMYDAIK